MAAMDLIVDANSGAPVFHACIPGIMLLAKRDSRYRKYIVNTNWQFSKKKHLKKLVLIYNTYVSIYSYTWFILLVQASLYATIHSTQ